MTNGSFVCFCTFAPFSVELRIPDAESVLLALFTIEVRIVLPAFKHSYFIIHGAVRKDLYQPKARS